MSRRKKEMMQGYIYILPSLFFMVCFCLLPIVMSTYFSFTDYNAMTPANFVGFDNYKKVFQDPYIIDAIKNTFTYVLITVPIQTFLSLVFAAFLANKMQNLGGNFLRSVMVIPVIASAVTSGAIWRTIFTTDGGIINSFLEFFGIQGPNWLGDSKTALICICVVAIWKNVGYFLVIYYAGIMGLSPELYEAARVDGATTIQQFFKITMPLLKPINYLVITLGIIWSFQVFDLSYLMTSGGPGRSTVTIVMGIYNAAFKEYRMGYACAMAILLLLVILVINIIENTFFKEKPVKGDAK